jgi:hypothetical protein
MQVNSEDPDTNLVMPPSQHAMQTCSKDNFFKPKSLPNSLIRYPLRKALTATNGSADVKPTSYSTTSKHSTLRDAMKLEFDALLCNDTWTLIPPNSDMNIVGCK